MLQTSHILLEANKPGQDRVLDLNLGSRVILAVTDGAGGRSGGAEASEMAIQHIQSRAATLSSQDDCEKLLRELDQIISKDAVAGETTSVVCVMDSNRIFGASSGDSGAWVVDQTSVDELTRNQIRKPFLGTGVAPVVGFSRERFGGILLVATDGLLKYASRESISDVIRHQPFETITEKLISLVRYPSGDLPDDIAAALYRSKF
jgi:serine/threonine protein phosphatase PrpC